MEIRPRGNPPMPVLESKDEIPVGAGTTFPPTSSPPSISAARESRLASACSSVCGFSLSEALLTRNLRVQLLQLADREVLQLGLAAAMFLDDCHDDFEVLVTGISVEPA